MVFSRLPTTQVDKVDSANGELIGVAKDLLDLTHTVDDPRLKAALQTQISKLLSISKTVSGAVESTAYFPPT